MKKQAVGIVVLVGLILFCAFQSSFLGGLQVLGEIVNIFGTLFVWFLKLIFSIPQVAEEIIKRALTTLLIAIFTTMWCVQDKTEKKIVGIIAKIIVAIIMVLLSWVGLF